jgi:hypothetical protein
MQQVSKKSQSDETEAEAEGKNDIVLSVDQITRPPRPRCRNARVCISRAEADVTAVEGFGLLSVVMGL